jgi:hypothetical protein
MVCKLLAGSFLSDSLLGSLDAIWTMQSPSRWISIFSPSEIRLEAWGFNRPSRCLVGPFRAAGLCRSCFCCSGYAWMLLWPYPLSISFFRLLPPFLILEAGVWRQSSFFTVTTGQANSGYPGI